jgi:hypothetical protein
VTKRALQPPPAFPVAVFDKFDAYAIRALTAGEATKDQQQRAMKWIVNGAAMLMSQAFVPGQPDTTAFNEGRRNVAKQILHLTACELEP